VRSDANSRSEVKLIRGHSAGVSAAEVMACLVLGEPLTHLVSEAPVAFMVAHTGNQQGEEDEAGDHQFETSLSCTF
jgi:hypothetical protein